MTSAVAPDGVTRVAIDPRRALGQVDRRIYGGFVEHLGRCIYGGLYEPGSGLSDDRGFRADVLSLLKDLRLSVLRWPGGNFASNSSDRRSRTIAYDFGASGNLVS